ncbi:MAG: heat-inducible transcription repressor HrcA [Acidobacteria bacterium]|nr:MAG: heat-inducible transcription repressor HrcA [Acidobacteriota bacterium]PYQ89307.1 MAG: heat-inducible transcription repressor HrcA [Acidobacteriota bacterium]PYR08868.1 MAG: heat-inducible transcription repressor HrcA [Acidobacteriota bacterium]
MEAQDRSKRVLAALVREFISSGEPVASSLLVSAAGLGVSSATVRSILARLEEEGFVQQPHTSAGRIPTDRGYRFYVDLLLEVKRPNRTATAVEARLRRESPDRLLDSMLPQVSHVLSQASRSVGFAVGPAHEVAVFDRVEFVPIAAARVLVVIVARGGHVVQKVIDTGEPLGADDLRQAANYLNAEFTGLPLHRAREAVLERIQAERLLYDALLARAMRLATSTFSDFPDDRMVYVEGTSSLLEDGSGLTLGTLQMLLQMIDEKQTLVRVLNEYIDGPGLTVVIGAEHLDPTLRPFSLVASTYDDGAGTGTVGVIGPTRMRYSRAIAVVDGAAQAVSRLLRDPN